jgi:hypothetical protein
MKDAKEGIIVAGGRAKQSKISIFLFYRSLPVLCRHSRQLALHQIF